MASLKAGGTFIFLPGKDGSLSKHPKKDVKQINYGLLAGSTTKDLDTLKTLVEEGKLFAHVEKEYGLDEIKKMNLES